MTLVRPLIHFGHLLYRTLQVVEGRLRALKKKKNKRERLNILLVTVKKKASILSRESKVAVIWQGK